MKILLTTSEIGNNAGGLAYHCLQLKSMFEKMGHIVFTEVLLDDRDSITVFDGGYDICLGKKIRKAYKLKQMDAKYGKDIDLCISCGAGLTAYMSMLFCKKKSIPLKIVLCGSEVNLACGNTELAYFNEHSVDYADDVIGISNELIENIQLFSNNESCRYHVIPIICDMNTDISDKISKKETDQIVFSTGASFLGEKKGIANLIAAFSRVIHDMGRNDLLYLFGQIDDDIKRQYISLTEELNVEKNVFFCGYLSRNDYIMKMNDVDVYIQASPFEGFGLSIVEAISSGKDILISNSGFIAEHIRDEYPGHIIKCLNTESLADTISNYIKNTFYKKEQTEIRKTLVNLLAEENIINQWENVLSEGYVRKRYAITEEVCNAVMFHDVDCTYSGVDYAVEGFECLLKKVSAAGYRLCSARDYFTSIDRRKLIICTFDDGYENVYSNALPIMKEYGFTATVFVCPDLIGKNNSWNHRDDVNRKHLTHEMICDLVQEGWEIGSHGLSHINMLRLSEHELDECLGESKRLLSKYGEIETFCYPYGIFNMYIKGKVGSYYKRAFSVEIGGTNYWNDPYQIVRYTPEKLLSIISS